MNRNLVVWILLIVLTAASYLFAETVIGRFSFFASMAIAFAKCSLVGFQFMELNKAHVFWRLAFVSVIGIFILFVSVVVLE